MFQQPLYDQLRNPGDALQMLAKVATNRETSDDAGVAAVQSPLQQRTIEAAEDTDAQSRPSYNGVSPPSWDMEMQVLLDILLGQVTVSRLLRRYG